MLQILTQELAPSLDLIATVKHLYETKLKVLICYEELARILFLSINIFENQVRKPYRKFVLQDVSILIPLLSSLTKDEVSFYFLSIDSALSLCFYPEER